MENSIKVMRIRHKAEIKDLQERCIHETTKTVVSPFERHTICKNCGKILKRER